MTKDNNHQGMAELLAKQRADLPLTPSEAARQRRSRQAQDALASGSAGSSQDRPLAEEDLPLRQQATAERPAMPGRLRHALSRVASNRKELLAAACAVAVSLACWLAASRRRK